MPTLPVSENWLQGSDVDNADCDLQDFDEDDRDLIRNLTTLKYSAS